MRPAGGSAAAMAGTEDSAAHNRSRCGRREDGGDGREESEQRRYRIWPEKQFRRCTVWFKTVGLKKRVRESYERVNLRDERLAMGSTEKGRLRLDQVIFGSITSSAIPTRDFIWQPPDGVIIIDGHYRRVPSTSTVADKIRGRMKERD
jgi:hypothetical protein